MKRGFIRKRCPRCGGNIYIDIDPNGWYEECLQCGNTSYTDALIEVQEEIGNEGFITRVKSPIDNAS